MKKLLFNMINDVIVIIFIVVWLYIILDGFEKEDRRMDIVEAQVQTLMEDQGTITKVVLTLVPDMPDTPDNNPYKE